MTEKIGTIKNPLTIIAIFAGIAEVSGTIVLPFVAPENQLTFIYFLIIFPSVLVIVFFVTLNFNNKALYAPSDFTNEENYIKIFRYDFSRQEEVQIKVSQDEMLKILNSDLSTLKNFNEDRFKRIETEIRVLRMDSIKEESDNDIEIHTFDVTISISNFKNAQDLVKRFRKKGYETEIYELDLGLSNIKDHKSIWLGYKVPLDIAKDIILIAKLAYPHLEYIDLSNTGLLVAPEYIHSEIFIGGSTDTSITRGLRPLGLHDWELIRSSRSLEELHSIIMSLQ